MSKTIDERVVEMRFDNKQFESNVATSMSTLEKLKRSLKFEGASKGLENVNSAAKRVDMNALGSAVESVKAKFSALDVMAVTALANITNSAVNAGKHIVSALTIDPVKSGFQEYETQINSVQTILANTSSKGTTIDQVNEALDELNHYADLTIYNFTEMTRNIGTFTAAGIDLKTSVSAIQGIANLAAVSGSNSQQASTAMYQLSQALATGTVKLMDWNSVVNAGMGGEVFQNALKETSRLLGTGADEAIEASGSFRESLSDGWFTAEVLTETLKKFTTSGAAEYLSKFTGLSQETVDATLKATDAWGDEANAIDKAAEALASKSGKNKDEIKAALQMAKNAEDAAKKVKTFTQLWGVIKESVQSGWSSTWKIIIGDFEEAKALLTPLSNVLTGFINKMSDWRNNILQGALDFSKPWASITEKINGIAKPINKIVDAVSEVTEAVTDFDSIVNKVIHGDFGNGEDRFTALTKAGINYYKVQNKVNEAVGNSFRYSEKQIEAQDRLLSSQEKTTEIANKTTVSTEKVTEAYAKLSDEQLEQAGLTKDEISLYRALEKEANRLGISVSYLTKEMSENDGRSLLIDSFKNAGDGIIGVAKAIKDAWIGIFNPPGAGELAVKLYGAIKSLNKFSEKLRLTDKNTGELNETGKKLQRTFKGVFAIADVVTTVLGGTLKTVLKVINSILSHFNLNILDVTAAIGDALVAFDNWFNSIFDISGLLDNIAPTEGVKQLVAAITDLISAFRKLFSGEVDATEFASTLGKSLGKLLVSLPKIAIDLGKNFITGFGNGLSDGISGIIKKVLKFCSNFVSAFARALGEHSPSVIAYDDGVNWVQGFINGIKSMLQSVIGAIQPIVDAVKMVFSSFWKYITDDTGNIEWDKIFTGGIAIESLVILKTFADSFEKIANALTSFNGIITGVSNALKSFSKVLNGMAWDFKAKAILKMAIAIGILVTAVYILTQIPSEKIGMMWNAVGIIVALSLVLVGLAWAMKQFSVASVEVNKEGASIKGIQSAILQIGLALLLTAAAVKIISNIDSEKAERGFKGLAGMAVGMVVFLAAIGGISRYAKDISGVGKMMVKLSLAMILMAAACKLIGMLSADEIGKGILFAAAFSIFIMAITAVSKFANENISKVGGMALKLSIAMVLLVGVCKLVGMLSYEEMLKGAAFAGAFVLFVFALVSVTKMGGDKQLAKVSGLVLSVSFSLLLMAGVCKLISQIPTKDLIKGAIVVAGFMLLLKMMVEFLKIGNDQTIAKVSASVLAMSTAIAIMAGTAIILGMVDTADLAKGVIAVGILGTIMALMVHSLKGAQNVKGSIIAMAATIAIIAGSIVALSLIDDTESLIRATACMTLIMGIYAIIIRGLKGLQKGKISTGPLIALVGVTALMAGIIYLLATNIKDSTAAIAAAGSLSVLMLAMSAVLVILNGIKVNIKNALIGILALTAMILPLFAFVGVLAVMSNVSSATTNTITLIALAGAMTALLYALLPIGAIVVIGGGVGVGLIAAGILALTAMAVPLLAFVGVLAVMSNVKNAMTNTMLLTTFMAVMTDLLVKISSVAPLAVIGVAAMDGLVLLIGAIGAMAVAIGWLTEKCPDIQKFLNAGLPVLEQLAGSIGTMIGEFIGGIGGGLGDGLVKIGNDIAAFMATISVASTNASMIKGESFDGVKELMKVMLEIGGTTVGTTFADIFTLGGTSMEKFEKDSVAFFNAMKTIGESTSDVNINADNMNAIIGVAQKLVELQSTLEPMGGVVTWFTGRDDLGRFGINVAAFVGSMKLAFDALDGAKLNTTAMSSVISAATSLSELQSHLEPIGGVVTWFTGRDDLGRFGINAAAFVGSMKLAFDTLDGATLNETALESVITAATKLAELQSTLEPMGGVVTWFTGRSDLGAFGINIALFADAMSKLKTGMGEDGITAATITSITNTGTALIELQKALPEEHWFDGKMNLSDFADRIDDFATAMGTLGSKASEINSSAVSTIITIAYRVKGLISSLTDLDTSGLQTFTGIGIGGVGADGAAYEIAQAIAAFSKKVSDIDTEAVSVSVWAAQKLKSLIGSLASLDTSGIENFKPNNIGSAMKGYSDEVSGIDTERVVSSITSANRLKSFIASLANLDASGIGNFRISSIGSSLQVYSTSVSNFSLEAVESSIIAANELRDFIASLSGFDTNDVGSFKSAVNDLSGINISAFVKAFEGSSGKLTSIGSDMTTELINGMRSNLPTIKSSITSAISSAIDAAKNSTSKFENAGKAIMVNMADGMTSKKKSASSAVTSCLSKVLSDIRNYYTSFYSAGSYLVTGFANGISGSTYRAAAKAEAMAEAAIRSARETLKINSPSKVFKSIGSGIPEGFAMGIGMLSGDVKDSVVGMTSTAVKATKSTMGTVLDALSADMDAQPTIRPIVDLSDVRTGASAINGMLNDVQTIGVRSNLNAIGVAMNNKVQNASNDDVVSAIDKLRDQLNRTRGDTYNFGNFTYDDSDNISDAVQTLVRAAKMGRRV